MSVAMPFLRSTEPLRRELAAALPSRPFVVELWDGTSLPATSHDGPVRAVPTFFVRSPKALGHLLRRPGQLGLGRAYVAGCIDVDDLDAALDVVLEWDAPELEAGQRARLLLAAARAVGPAAPPPVPAIERRQRGRLHSLARDRAAIDYHYNVGNDFFKTFLDDSMTYSCAIFSRGATTLEEAQDAKRELICTKLALQPGERVLDLGCGWGSFAIHAAQRHGARVLGVTLSDEQARLARQRVADAGVADRVEIRLADYRELQDEPFDAIASIGMVEHVGSEQIDVYARQLWRLLRPGGRLLNHGIARLRHENVDAGPFNERYVFPDGEPLQLSRMLLALELAGFVTHHVEGFADDYAETLRHWARNFDANYDEAVRVAGPERARVWRLYLRAARNGFENGFTSIYQVRAAKPA